MGLSIVILLLRSALYFGVTITEKTGIRKLKYRAFLILLN